MLKAGMLLAEMNNALDNAVSTTMDEVVDAHVMCDDTIDVWKVKRERMKVAGNSR
jgi:hypothetical protein